MKKAISKSHETASLFAEGKEEVSTIARLAKRSARHEKRAKTRPPESILYGGKTIAAWKAWETEGNAERDEADLYQLFRDEREAFYLVTTRGTEVAILELMPSEALAWTMEQCFKGWAMDSFFHRVCAGFVCTLAEGKSFGLSKQLGKGLARSLRTVAAKEGRAPFDQLRVFLMDGLANYAKQQSRRFGRKHAVSESRATQLELATTLVEVVRKLETAPSGQMLAYAQLAAEELNQSLRAELPAKIAAAG